MATIGISIEYGSLQTVLMEPTSGEVLADRVTPLSADSSSVLAAAVEAMRAEALESGVDVTAVGVVYRTDDERAEFASALADEPLVLSSASESFLGWLARSEELADAQTVLLYYMGETGVSISLADAAEASLTPARKAVLDSMSPERIGSTIPLAWEVVDQSGKKPEFVALFGDSSSNRDLIDIISLGLGVPVVRVGDADQVAARGAALLAHIGAGTQFLGDETPTPESPTTSDDPVPDGAPNQNSDVASTVPVPAVAPARAAAAEPENSAEPDATAEPTPAAAAGTATAAGTVTASGTVTAAAPVRIAPQSIDAKPARSGRSGRKLVLAGVMLAGVLSAGVAVAATVTGESESPTDQSVERRDGGADLAGATRSVNSTTTAPVVAEAPPVSVDAPPPETVPATADAADPVDAAPLPAPRTAPAAPPPPVVAAPPAPRPAPAPVTTKVDPPQFTVPVVVPEPGKSQEQLEKEAWDRHWQHTGEWIEQEFSGG